MSVKTIDPFKVVTTFGGNIISGYADGTFLNISRPEDMFVTTVGANGEVVRVKSNNTMTEITLTLLQSSLSNDILSGIAVLDEISNLGVLPFAVKDLSGLTTFFAGDAWIKKFPDQEFGKEAQNREWVFTSAQSLIFIGGNF